MSQQRSLDHWSKLLLFKDIVDKQGFSNAARYRGVSHATVSKQLKALEAALGVTLLERSSRSMTLTEEGRIAYQHSQRIGAQFDDLLEDMEARRSGVRGELRVGALLHISKHIVQPAVAAFLQAHPLAQVTLLLDDGPLNFTRNGLDCAVRVGQVGEGELHVSKLMDNPVCIVASPNLLQRCGQPQHPAELANFPTVAYATEVVAISVWSYLEDGAQQTVAVRPVYQVNDGNALLDAARAGIGIAYVSAFAAQADLAAGNLVRLLPDFRLPDYEPVCVIRGRALRRSSKLQAFMTCLNGVVAKLS